MIHTLKLLNFRNYESVEFSFSDRLNFIIGRNGSGKTNVLEAISILSMGKSFRGASDSDLIREGQNGYFIKTEFDTSAGIQQLSIGMESTGGSTRRKIKYGQKSLNSRAEMIGHLSTVVFSPDDLEIVQGGSQSRRKYLDSLISSFDRLYLDHLIQYNRAIKQRNAVLKSIREKKSRLSDIDPWNLSVASIGCEIINRRYQFLNQFTPFFQENLDQISEGKDRVSVKSSDTEIDEETYISKLKDLIYRDIATGYTTFGPHRDRIRFESDDRNDIQHRFSQGQKRSLVLALRIAQFYFVRDRMNKEPVLLIDDVIRELDVVRRKHFVRVLHENCQALFTTPDLDGLEDLVSSLKPEQIMIRNGQKVLNDE